MPRGGARPNTGPSPKPSALKVLHGSRQSTVNKNEPQPKKAGLDPPKWLGREGRVVWREYAPGLSAMGLLTELDVEMFAQACALAAVARTLFPGSADHMKVVDAAGRILGRFGFTPSERTKISVTPKTDDPFEKFLSGKKAK